MEVAKSQEYRLLKKAWTQIKDDIDESGINRHELLSWSIQTLMAAAGKAMQQKNPGAVVSAIRQLDHMTGAGCKSHRGYGFQGACTSRRCRSELFQDSKAHPSSKRECPLGSKHRFPWGLLAVTTQLQSQGERPLCHGLRWDAFEPPF